ncbi:MAG TPA: DUF4105 domain-containing protein [Longimicrobium sp.]|nr:DUF4105 domain-containing protein [Longimicrobium sp.]
MRTDPRGWKTMQVRTLALRAALALAGAATLAAAPLAAQAPAQPSAPDTAIRIVLLTMGPGDPVWEKFGHNALWVHDPATGSEKAYNYGMFDFRQENFILNFARGRMDYWMEGFDAYLTADHYRQLNRSVWAQELNLTPAQARRVAELLRRNELPENRFYRYDYYRDNCSTRLRDILDQVLGGALKRATESQASGTTYRWHTRRLMGQGAANGPMFTAIDFGLGPAADRPISRWEQMFLPMKLHDEVAALRVPDANGRPVPLVVREQTMFTATRPPEPARPPGWLGGYVLAGLALAGVIVALGIASRHGAAGRFGFALVTSLWLLFAGTGGLILLGLWTATDHAIAYRNENILQLSPLALPLVLLIPALGYGARWAGKWAVRLAFAVAALSVLGLLLQVLPWIDQANGHAIALALPANLAIAWAAWYLAAVSPDVRLPEKAPKAQRKRLAV